MEEQLNLQWHEINSNTINRQPMIQENRTFRKSNVVIVFWVIMFIFFWLVLLVWVTDNSFWADEGSIIAMRLLIILEIVFMFKIFWAYLTIITIWRDSLIYRKWVLFRHSICIGFITFWVGSLVFTLSWWICLKYYVRVISKSKVYRCWLFRDNVDTV